MNTLSRHLASGLVVATLAACQPSSPPPSQPAPSSTSHSTLAPPSTAPAPATPVGDVATLRQEGKKAYEEQRLYTPAGNNAVEFFLAARKAAPATDPTVEGALIDLVPYVVIGTEQAIAREDFDEARRLVALIKQADPTAPALPRLTDSITSAQAAAASRTLAEQALAEKKNQEEAARQLAAQQAAQAAVAQAAAQQAAQASAPKEPPPTPIAKPVSPPVERTPEPVAAKPAPSSPAGPVAINTPQPIYPPAALRDHQSGEVTVRISIGADGSVTNVSIESAKPRGVFDRAVLSAVHKWTFQPSSGPQTLTRTFSFKAP